MPRGLVSSYGFAEKKPGGGYCSFAASGYNINMKFLLFPLFLLLCACGPKEIGQDSSEPPPGRGNYSAAERLRQPMTGASRTERMLYYYNQPDIMQRVRDWRVEQFNRRMGVSPENPAYRAEPRQKSPFRDQ